MKIGKTTGMTLDSPTSTDADALIGTAESKERTAAAGTVGTTIGRTIRDFRQQRGLSQGDIEKRTGLLRCYLSRVENCHTVPSLDTLGKIAQALDVPLAHFFAEGGAAPELPLKKISDEELRFLTQIRRYSASLNDSDKKLLLAMVRKFATVTGSGATPGAGSAVEVAALRS